MTEIVYRRLGANIKRARGVLGITQFELASKVGLTRTSVCNIEAGRQRILFHHVMTFAAAFHMHPEALLKGVWNYKP